MPIAPTPQALLSPSVDVPVSLSLDTALAHPKAAQRMALLALSHTEIEHRLDEVIHSELSLLCGEQPFAFVDDKRCQKETQYASLWTSDYDPEMRDAFDFIISERFVRNYRFSEPARRRPLFLLSVSRTSPSSRPGHDPMVLGKPDRIGRYQQGEVSQ